MHVTREMNTIPQPGARKCKYSYWHGKRNVTGNGGLITLLGNHLGLRSVAAVSGHVVIRG